MRAAAVQLNSTGETDRNRCQAESLVRAAADDGAAPAAAPARVFRPERGTALGGPDVLAAGAEPLDGPTVAWARDLARELGIDLVAGSIVEDVEGREKRANTSLHVGPDGAVRAVYRKIHLFDVDVGGRTYRESDGEDPGTDVWVSSLADGTPLGMTVCYDVRFPELYRALADRGARVVAIPSAFT